MKKILLLSLAICSLAPMLQAQSHEDERVQYYLEKRGYEYTKIDENEGELRIFMDLGNGRTQSGYIDTKDGYFPNGAAYREVVSLVYVNEIRPNEHELFQILQYNAKLERGAFEINENEGNYVIRYMYRIASDFTEREIMDAFYYAITVADQLESVLTPGEDEE